MSEKVPSDRASPIGVEKAGSSSSRESESSIHFDFDSYIPSKSLLNCEEKIRPSSWDESDDDFSPENFELHLSDSQKFKASVAAEINELKKQFFESLQKLKNTSYQQFENATNVIDVNLEDRRQCPARVRRRTKSSSSLSPVLEAKNHNSTEKLSGLDEKFNEVSAQILEFDSKYYLNNFFNELRMKRISLIDPPPKPEEEEEEEDSRMKTHVVETNCNDLDSSENDEHFCKTSRKLSQIIEVEESKRDLERSSEEMSDNSTLFSKSIKKSEENVTPLQTARSRSEKISENFEKPKKQNFKTLSFEEFEDLQKVQKPFQGSLSARSSKFFKNKPRDNFSFLSVKSPKSGMKFFNDRESKSPDKVVSFNSQSENDTESGSKKDENLDSIDRLKIDLIKDFSENATPRSTDRSEPNRTRSRKSDSTSPKFRVNINKDSARSLRLEDVNSPDSVEKIREDEIETSPIKSRRNLDPENNFEQKSDRNLQIPLKSPSLESEKSVSSFTKIKSSKSKKSKSTDRSQREKGRISLNSSGTEPTECYSLSCEVSPRSRMEFSMPENYDMQSQRSTKTPYHSNRSSKSEKIKTPNTAKERFLGYSFDHESPTPELELQLDISESQKSSYRSSKTAEEKNSSRSDINNFLPISRRSSDRSSSLKSKNTGSTKGSKLTPKSKGSVSTRSKESIVNFNETENWLEFVNNNDSSSNRTSARSTSRKSSWRKQKPSSSPNRRTNSERDDFDAIKSSEFLEERRSVSEKSSKKSTRSSSPKSVKLSSNSPPDEDVYTNPYSGRDKPYLEVENQKNSNKISSPREPVGEINSPRNLKLESESDGCSEKKLSIINEVSFEDLDVSNDYDESEGQSQRSTSQNREFLPQTNNRSSKNANVDRKQTPRKKSPPEHGKLADGEKWNELIEAFGESPNSGLNFEKTFSHFLRDTNWETLKDNTYGKNDDEDQKTSPRITGNKFETPEKYFPFENELEEKEEDSKKSKLDKEEKSFEKPTKKDLGSLQNFQNLYYLNINDRGPFGIGECGDVTNWNADKSDNPERPKGYGDGMQPSKISDVLTVIGKRDKEIKTQRHLWTDSKGDIRNSKQNLMKLFAELENQAISKQDIPIVVKTSKSDNCITKNEDQISANCEPKNKSASQFEKTPKNIDFSIESLECEKYEIENIEFECKTPRLSRSMINLNIQLEEETFEEVDLNTNVNSSGSQLFERATAITKGEKESTNLNIFLARNQKEEKTPPRTNNWLNFKTLEMDNFNKKDKQVKKKKKEIIPKEKNQEYLTTGKCRSSIPPLKLRNPNCFQNFYKRIVSVFCLTTHSSAATSK